MSAKYFRTERSNPEQSQADAITEALNNATRALVAERDSADECAHYARLYAEAKRKFERDARDAKRARALIRALGATCTRDATRGYLGASGSPDRRSARAEALDYPAEALDY